MNSLAKSNFTEQLKLSVNRSKINVVDQTSTSKRTHKECKVMSLNFSGGPRVGDITLHLHCWDVFVYGGPHTYPGDTWLFLEVSRTGYITCISYTDS